MRGGRITRAFRSSFGRWLAIAGLLALGYLSLAPERDMIPRPGYPRPAEHFAAYLTCWIVVGLAFAPKRLLPVLAGAVCLAGIFELLQNFSPGRTPSVYDFTGSTLGAVSGLLLARWSRTGERVALSSCGTDRKG